MFNPIVYLAAFAALVNGRVNGYRINSRTASAKACGASCGGL